MSLRERLLKSSFGFSGIVFWVCFVLMGAGIALMAPLEIVIGLLVIMLGISRISIELGNKRASRERKEIQQALENMSKWLQRDYELIQGIQQKYDRRFFRLAKKEAETRKRIEKGQSGVKKEMDQNYRDVARKILQLDNKLMEISRAFLTKPPRSGRKK